MSDPSVNHGCAGCNRRSYCSSKEDICEVVGIGSGSAVESVPAEPEDKYAEGAEGHGVTEDRVRLAVLSELADTRTDHLCTNEGAQTADHVDTCGTSEVNEAHLSQPAAAPDPVSLDRVNDRADNAGVDAVAEEFRSFCHRAGNDSCGSRAENEVEHELSTSVEVRETAENVEVRNTDQTEERILAEQESETKKDKYYCADTEVHVGRHDDVAGGL